MYKFEVGQTVRVAGYITPRVITNRTGNLYKVDGLSVWQCETHLTLDEPEHTDIQVKYVFDGLTFDTKEAALDHKREVQLFDLVKDIQPDYFIVGDVIRRLITNKQKVLEILK